jgi:excisionase family DNA binding protein
MRRRSKRRSDGWAFTYGQVAETANISERMVRKLVKEGRLRVVHIGRCARVPRSEVRRLCGC